MIVLKVGEQVFFSPPIFYFFSYSIPFTCRILVMFKVYFVFFFQSLSFLRLERNSLENNEGKKKLLVDHILITKKANFDANRFHLMKEDQFRCF